MVRTAMLTRPWAREPQAHRNGEGDCSGKGRYAFFLFFFFLSLSLLPPARPLAALSSFSLAKARLSAPCSCITFAALDGPWRKNSMAPRSVSVLINLRCCFSLLGPHRPACAGSQARRCASPRGVPALGGLRRLV